MKTHPMLKLASLLAVALFAAGFTTTASADGPNIFYPVRSAKDASKIKPGSQVAMTCGDCHSVSVLTVNPDRSNLRSYKCPTCKKTFVPAMASGDRAPGTGGYAYKDESGHMAYLSTAH